MDLTCRERRGGMAKGRPGGGWTPGGGDGNTQGTAPCSVLPPREETHAQAAPAFVDLGAHLRSSGRPLTQRVSLRCR